MSKEQTSIPPQVNLLPEDRSLLETICQAERRPAAYQVSWLIRQEAARRGLLPLETRSTDFSNQPITASAH